MPRRIFPAGSVTNTTGAPLRLTFHADAATGRREVDLWTVDGSNNLSERIPNGVILADVTGAYSAFAGPDDADVLYMSVNGEARTAITATSSVGSALALDTGGVNVDRYRRSGDLDDTQAWQRAVTAATTFGVKRVYGNAASYTVSSSIDLAGCSGLTIQGAGMFATTIHATASMGYVFTTTGDCSNVTICDLGFAGTAVDDVTVTAPRRSRTYSTSGTFTSAVGMTGDLVPTGGPYPVISNITISRISVSACAGLPVLLKGIRGEARIESSRFYLTYDVGWTHCESAVCLNNTSIKSCDNGFSLSRGNSRVLCVGNTVDGCAYYGIWVAGFVVGGGSEDIGPERFAVTGNTVTNAGKGGIHLMNAPKYGTVSGNLVDNVMRGPSDQLSDLGGVGVFVGGFPDTTPSTPTDYATGIGIVGNTLRSCARGGILVRGAKDITVRANTIIDPGSQYLADGTTAILSSDVTTNFGVAVEAAATVTRLSIRNNAIVDTRGTPYANYPFYTTGSTSPDYSNNYSSGCRQTVTADNTDDSYAGTKTFSGNTKHSGGATAGSNSASGTVAGYDINGAAGSTRPMRWLTAGTARWHLQASSTAESGSNAGTDLDLIARKDDGTLNVTVASIRRSDGQITLGDAVNLSLGSTTGTRFGTTTSQKIGFYNKTPIAQQGSTPSAATDLATALTLLNDLRAKLIALGLIA